MPNCAIARSSDAALSCVGRIRKSMSAEYRGKPYQETAKAPTTRYSTLFGFKHSINSRKSLLKGIRVGSLLKFEKDIDPLLRSHRRAGACVGVISIFQTGEHANYFLHNFNSSLRESLNSDSIAILSGPDNPLQGAAFPDGRVL
jgi:hypothetical protein